MTSECPVKTWKCKSSRTIYQNSSHCLPCRDMCKTVLHQILKKKKTVKKNLNWNLMTLKFHRREDHFRLLSALHVSPWFDICNARGRWLIRRKYVFKTFVSITRSGSLVTTRCGGDRDVGAEHVAAEMMNQTRSSSGIIQRPRRREGGGRKLASVCVSSSLIIPPHVPEQTLLTWA